MKRGFTMIELLVVITIILVLAGMAIVNYQKYKRVAILENARDQIYSCMLEMLRQNALNSSKRDYLCKIIDSPDTCPMRIDLNGGIIISCNFTLRGERISCKRKGGAITCAFL